MPARGCGKDCKQFALAFSALQYRVCTGGCKEERNPGSTARATVGETKTCLGIGRMAGRFQPQTSIQGPSLEGKVQTAAEFGVGSKKVDQQQRHSRQETNWCTDAR